MKNFPLLFPLLMLLFSGCNPDENHPKATALGISNADTLSVNTGASLAASDTPATTTAEILLVSEKCTTSRIPTKQTATITRPS